YVLSRAHQARREWPQAINHLRAVLRSQQRLDGQDHPRTKKTRLELAGALYGEASALYDRSEMARAVRFGTNPLPPGTPKDNAALALVARGIPLVQEALQIEREAHGPGGPSLIRGLGVLAQFYRLKGDYKKAAPLMVEQEKITRTALGERNLAYLSCLVNLT